MEAESGYVNVASKWHEPLRVAMVGYRNTVMKAEEIRKVAENIPGVGNEAKFIQASDHCVNMTNKGECRHCATTDQALFERVRHGFYLVR